MTQLAGQDRYDWISQEVKKYRKRKRRAAGLYLLTGLETFFLIPIIVVLPFNVRPSYATAVLFIFLATVLSAGWLNQRAEKLLPPVEDRILYRLKPSITSLKAYVREWNESERKNALKNLRRVASILDVWNPGNVKFLKDEVGDTLAEFKRNFRGRVLLAVKRADKASIPDLLLWLTNFHSALDSETLNKVSLETWNKFLSQSSQTNSTVSRFPYHEPRQNVLRRLTSQWFKVVVALSVPIVPIISGLFDFYVLNTTASDASIVAATVFTGMTALAYLIFSRQKATS